MTHAFEDIEVKENAITLLEEALKKTRKKCMVGTGSMTDPYIGLETELGYVRKSLTLIEKYGHGFTVITKSNRILRDLDLLQRINEKTKCVVQMTLTTADEELCKQIEPNVSTTKERVLVLKELQKAGIPTVVWLSPILPFINDTEENIAELLGYCVDAGVYGVIYFGAGMTLREGNREYFYEQLDKKFPGLKECYIKTYGNQYIVSSPNNKALSGLFYQICRKNGIACKNEQIFSYLQAFEEKQTQLSLFD